MFVNFYLWLIYSPLCNWLDVKDQELQLFCLILFIQIAAIGLILRGTL